MQYNLKHIKLKKGTKLYHGTICDYNMSDIRTPCWLSILKDQAVNHVNYRHHGCNGYLLTYKLNRDINIVNISGDGNVRLYVNAHGNHALANKMKEGEFGNIDGYINYDDQAEVMITKNDILDGISKEPIELYHKVRYKKIYLDKWRMEKSKNHNCLCQIM
tara:strand:- start:108 stop:590 length:483 start_codon:yes stop_codon:yes gene_type:complete